MESAQAREDRKKRVCLSLSVCVVKNLHLILQKEAKKAAKLQAQLVQQNVKPVTPTFPSTSTQITQSLPHSGNARSIGTPKQSVGTPRPGSAGARPMVRVGSTLPKLESAASKTSTPIQEHTGTPVIMKDTPMEVDQHRGKKREREEGLPMSNGVNVNGGAVQATINGYTNGLSNTNGLVQPAVVAFNAKAGTGNVRPRPIKKQRMVSHCFFFFVLFVFLTRIQDMTGQARDVTAPVQQQPTPQGV